MKFIGAVTVVIVCSIFTTLWYGYALTVLWAWFMPKTFGLSPLSIPAGLGLALIVQMLAPSSSSSDKDDSDSVSEAVVKAVTKGFFKPALALVIGYIVQLYI